MCKNNYNGGNHSALKIFQMINWSFDNDDDDEKLNRSHCCFKKNEINI